MIKKSLIIFILFFSLINISFWIYIPPKTQIIYDKLFVKLEKKNDLENTQKSLLNLKSKIISLKNYKKYKNNKRIIKLFNEVLYLNDEKIKEIRKIIILNNLKKDIKINNTKEKIWENKNYTKKYELEKIRRKSIIDKYDYSKYFKNISYTKNNIFLEDWIWKAYRFKRYSFFPTNLSITHKDLVFNWVDVNTDLLFVTDDNTLWFVRNPTKINLVSDEIIKNIDNKYYFLEEILDDVKKSWIKSYDSYFLDLKEKTEKITNNLSDSSKIQNIYNYILNNISYSEAIDFDNYRIFSWIETFKNNSWVCEWYAKLMSYMLMFAWINDVETIRWYVIDAEDFPDIWHAWVRIWNRYYDPTFDDPIWATSSKSFLDYKYFNLPKDLFYTNRYDFKDIPENIKKLSLEDRKRIILNNLNKVSNKYKNENYKLLKLLNFKKEHNIKYDEKITLENFNKILNTYDLYDFNFTKNWKNIKILKFKYYDVDILDLEFLIEQLDYNLDWYYLFKWYDNKGWFNYILAYDIITR